MTRRITSRLANLWQRWPITVVTTIVGLLVASWTYLDLSNSLTPTLRSTTDVQNIAPQPLMSLPEPPGSDTRSATAKHAPLSGFRRVQVTPNEVDYIAEDVTMRVFTTRPRQSPVEPSSNQVNIGDDVTVRYFASKVSPTQPVSHSLPVSK